MIVLIGMLLGTLAVIGVIRAIVLFLIKKIDNKQHWVAANFITALLRTIVALFQLWGAPIFLSIFWLFLQFICWSRWFGLYMILFNQKGISNQPVGG